MPRRHTREHPSLHASPAPFAYRRESGRQDAETLRAAEETVLVPVLPLEMQKDGLRVSLFTVIATFGTAQDVTADELRIESFFPADEATDELFRGVSASATVGP